MGERSPPSQSRSGDAAEDFGWPTAATFGVYLIGGGNPGREESFSVSSMQPRLTLALLLLGLGVGPALFLSLTCYDAGDLGELLVI
jgi:hypothetical protein